MISIQEIDIQLELILKERTSLLESSAEKNIVRLIQLLVAENELNKLKSEILFTQIKKGA